MLTAVVVGNIELPTKWFAIEPPTKDQNITSSDKEPAPVVTNKKEKQTVFFYCKINPKVLWSEL